MLVFIRTAYLTVLALKAYNTALTHVAMMLLCLKDILDFVMYLFLFVMVLIYFSLLGTRIRTLVESLSALSIKPVNTPICLTNYQIIRPSTTSFFNKCKYLTISSTQK